MNTITYTTITDLEKSYGTQNIIVQRTSPSYTSAPPTKRILSLDKCTPIDTDILQVYTKGQWFVAKKA